MIAVHKTIMKAIKDDVLELLGDLEVDADGNVRWTDVAMAMDAIRFMYEDGENNTL